VTQPPRYTNIELMARVGPLFGIAPADILGFVVVCVTTNNRVRLLSNGNQAQIVDLLTSAIGEVERVPGLTNEPDQADV
jgi:hypothetical protein